MKKFLKWLWLFVLGAVFLSTVFAAWRSTNWSSYDMLANRFLFTSGGTLSGDYILDTNSGGTIIAYGPLVDGWLNAYITGWDYVTLADSGVYFDANSGTYFETNSWIYFEANSGTYYTTNPSWYITGWGTLWNLVNPGGVVRILTPKDTTNYLGINVWNGNSVSQIGSSVIGTNNTLAGDYGFIAWSSCTNSASNTTTLGFKLNNNTQYNVALGKYNVWYTSWVLEVWYGAIESTRANFLTVFKDGSTWLTAKDMAGNAYITGWAISGSYVTIADSWTYFETNSWTYFLANSWTYYDSNPAGFIASIWGNDGDLCALSGTTVFCDVTPASGLVETDPIWTAASGVYFNLNSGTYFEANSWTYFLANSGAYYDSNPAGFITGWEISGNYVTLANSGAYYTTNPLWYITWAQETDPVFMALSWDFARVVRTSTWYLDFWGSPLAAGNSAWAWQEFLAEDMYIDSVQFYIIDNWAAATGWNWEITYVIYESTGKVTSYCTGSVAVDSWFTQADTLATFDTCYLSAWDYYVESTFSGIVTNNILVYFHNPWIYTWYNSVRYTEYSDKTLSFRLSEGEPDNEYVIGDGSTDGLAMFLSDGSLTKPNAYLNRGANVGLTNSTVGGVWFSAMTLYDLSNATGTWVSSTANLYTFRGTALNVAKAWHESVPISRIFSTMTIANSGGYEQSSPYLQIDAPTRGIGDLIQMFKNDVKKFWVDSTGDTHIAGRQYNTYGIDLGADASTCTGDVLGTMKFSGDNFYGCNSVWWVQLDN